MTPRVRTSHTTQMPVNVGKASAATTVHNPYARWRRCGNAYGMSTTTGAIHTPEARKNSRSVNIKRAPVPATITPTIDAVTRTARDPRKTGSLAGELDDDWSHQGLEALHGEERSARGSW